MIEWKMDRSRKLWATREFYMRDATAYDWGEVLADWGASLILCDPSVSEKEIVELRKKFGINIRPAMSVRRWKARVEGWRTRLCIQQDGYPGVYISPDCPNLWNELLNLAYYIKKGSEEVEESFAPGTLDHAWDAGAYGMSFFERGFIGAPRAPFELVRA